MAALEKGLFDRWLWRRRGASASPANHTQRASRSWHGTAV